MTFSMIEGNARLSVKHRIILAHDIVPAKQTADSDANEHIAGEFVSMAFLLSERKNSTTDETTVTVIASSGSLSGISERSK